MRSFIKSDKLARGQREVLEVIKAFQREHGYSPSIEELNQIRGRSSTSTAHYHLSALQRKGYIRREKGKQRAITLTKETEREAMKPLIDASIEAMVVIDKLLLGVYPTRARLEVLREELGRALKDLADQQPVAVAS